MKIIEYGKENEKAILCIPGVFLSGECFSALAGELPEYHLVCVTLDGFHPGCQVFESLEQQTEKLISLLQENQLTEFEAVMGLSMGTIFSVRLAKRPELKIRRLFLDGAVNFYRSRYKKVVELAITQIFSWFMKSARKNPKKSVESMRKVYTGDWPEKMQVCRASLDKKSLKVMAAFLADYELEPGVKQPMRLLYGGKEDNIKINSQVVKALYPEAEILVIPGYNHLGFLNRQPETYAGMVREFLKTE